VGSTGATAAFAGFAGQGTGTGGGGGGGGGGAGIVWLDGHPSCTRLGDTRPLLAPCR
jgi:prepilin-type processing-associated H-X9-DG protein